MFINTDSKIKDNKQKSNEMNEDENYFAKIVQIRLYHRKRVKKFSILIFISQSIYFLLVPKHRRQSSLRPLFYHPA